MFFSAIPPETLKKIAELRKKINKPSFEDYYRKRMMEEYGDYKKNPRVSFKHMMVLSHLYKTMRIKAQKEYDTMYN